MKIAYVTEAPIPSRAANAVSTLHAAAALGSLGHPTDVVCPYHVERLRTPEQRTALLRRFAIPSDVPIHYVPYVRIRGRLGGSFAPAAALRCRLGGYELVFSRSPRVALAAARLGLDVAVEFHSPPAGRGAEATRLLASHPRLRGFVYISERLRRLSIEAVPALAGAPDTVAHDAVDLERFTPQQSKAEARAHLGIAPGPPILVHVGHMYRGRGIELLLETVRRFEGALRLVLVGGAEADVARVRTQVAEMRLAGVEIVGHRAVAELPPYLFAADVLAMPYTASAVTSDAKTQSIEWASPMKLFEYLAAGRAIVASRFAATAEVLVDGSNALLVPPDDVDALHAAVRSLITDEALATTLAARARTDAASHTWIRREARVLDALGARR